MSILPSTSLHYFQSAYGGYVYSYAVKSIADLNKTEGAYLNALFWVSDGEVILFVHRHVPLFVASFQHAHIYQ